MEELEVKAQTVLTSTSPIPESKQNPSIMCAVDGCLNHATMNCEVKVANQQLAPQSEAHLVSLCQTHFNGFDQLKWQWRRTPDAAASPQLKLEGVYALDNIEDT